MTTKVSRRKFVTTTAGATAGLVLAPRSVFGAPRSSSSQWRPLKLHGHPQKAFYQSREELPLLSAQVHWRDQLNPVDAVKQAEGETSLSHAHLEAWAPIYAELPHEPFTLDYRIQLFHFAGQMWNSAPGNPEGLKDGIRYGLAGPLVTAIDWDRPDPVIGDPTGVVVRTLRVTVDPSRPFPNGAGEPKSLFVPENGWFHNVLCAQFVLHDGTQLGVEFRLPFYAIGNPAVPESHQFRQFAGFDFQVSARASAGKGANLHGTSTAEYNDVHLPILAPIAAPWSVAAHTQAYARKLEWPTPDRDRLLEVNDANFHNHVSGTTVQTLGAATGAGFVEPQINAPVVFDPAVGRGAHTKMLSWTQNTGAGNSMFPPNETLAALLIVPYTIWDGVGTPPPGVPVPPPPPPSPISIYGSVQHLAWSGVAPDCAVATICGDADGEIRRVTFALDGAPEVNGSRTGKDWARFLTLTPGSHTIVMRAYDAPIGGKVLAMESKTVVR